MNFSSACSTYYLPQIGGTRDIIGSLSQKRCRFCATTASDSCLCLLAKNGKLSCCWTAPPVVTRGSDKCHHLYLPPESSWGLSLFWFLAPWKKGVMGRPLRPIPSIVYYMPINAQKIIFNNEENKGIFFFQVSLPCPGFIGQHLDSPGRFLSLCIQLHFVLLKILQTWHFQNSVTPMWINIKRGIAFLWCKIPPLSHSGAHYQQEGSCAQETSTVSFAWWLSNLLIYWVKFVFLASSGMCFCGNAPKPTAWRSQQLFGRMCFLLIFLISFSK